MKDKDTQDLPPTTAHDWFLEARKVLGAPYIGDIWNKSPTEVYRWCRDPELPAKSGIQNDARQNPLLLLIKTMRELISAGEIDLARAARDMINRELGDESFRKGYAIPDKPTVLEELHDTFPAVVNFHQGILKGLDPDVTEDLCRLAKEELDQDQSAYCRDRVPKACARR